MREIRVGSKDVTIRTGWVRRSLVGRVETGYGVRQGEPGFIRRHAVKLPFVTGQKTSDKTIGVTAVVLDDGARNRGRYAIPLWTYYVTAQRDGEFTPRFRKTLADRQRLAALDVKASRQRALELFAAGVEVEKIGSTIRQEIADKVAARRKRRAPQEN